MEIILTLKKIRSSRYKYPRTALLSTYEMTFYLLKLVSKFRWCVCKRGRDWRLLSEKVK